MFICKRCDPESRDGATCVTCKAKYEFLCAGITEAEWRNLVNVNRREDAKTARLPRLLALKLVV